MRNKKYSYSEYMNDCKKLFIKLFGEELYNQINSVPLKRIKWTGADIDASGITATTPNVKERFTKSWVEYFSERDYTAFDIFLSTVFHYGYQQYEDNDAHAQELLKMFSKHKEELDKVK